MPAADIFWKADWSIEAKLSFHGGDKPILGFTRAGLLEAIALRRSISGAARQLGISYRHAWLLVQSMNEGAGEALVFANTGGKKGGGASLTPFGESMLSLFRELQADVERSAASSLLRRISNQEPAEVHLAAAVSLEGVIGRLLVDYALSQPKIRVRAVYGGSDALADQALAGAPIDILLSANDSQLDRLEKAGLLVSGSRVQLAVNRLAAVAADGCNLRVRKPADLLNPQVSRIALARPPCPLGEYTRAFLESHGLLAALEPSVLYFENARLVLAALQSRSADIGIVYASDVAQAERTHVLFLASRPGVPIRFTGALLNSGKAKNQARVVLDFLTSRKARQRFRGFGFLPIRAVRSRPV